jgi:hypothetical protein
LKTYLFPQPQVLLEAIREAREAVAVLSDIQPGDSREIRIRWVKRHHDLGKWLTYNAHRLAQESLNGGPTEDALLYYGQAIEAHRLALRALEGRREPELSGEAYLLIGRTIAERSLTEDQTLEGLKKAISVYKQKIKACPLKKGPQMWAQLQQEIAVAWRWIACCAECSDDQWIEAREKEMHCYEKIYQARETVYDFFVFSACVNLSFVMTELGKTYDGEDRKDLWRAADGFAREALGYPDSVRGTSDEDLHRGLRKLRRLRRWAMGSVGETN